MGFFDDAGSVPGLSWDGMARGTVVRGVVVPDADGKAYRETDQTHIETGEVLTYKDGSPRRQAILTLATELREWAATTDQFREKVEDDADAKDDGLRRLYVRGPSLPKEFKAALKKARMKDVVAGMTVAITFVGKKPVPESTFKSNVFSVEVTPPTPASLETAARHSDSGGALSSGKDDDPWASDPGSQDEPPF